MIKVEVRFDTSRLDRMLHDFPLALARAQKRVLAAAGQLVASRTTLAFRTPSMRPTPWAPRKKSKRDDGHPLLIKSGAMRQSIRWRLDGTNAVVVGSDKKYAPYHQHGTKKMPARPFFPIDAHGRLVPEMERKINRMVEKIYQEELGKL